MTADVLETKPKAVKQAFPWGRVLFAGPWVLLASFIVMASLGTVLPAGKAQVDNMIIPLVMFPAIWSVLFFHAILRKNLVRGVLENVAVTFACVLMLIVHFVTF